MIEDQDWRVQLAAARAPATPAQDAWDLLWTPIHMQSLRAGMAPGRAALRAMRVAEGRHGPRPEAKEAA